MKDWNACINISKSYRHLQYYCQNHELLRPPTMAKRRQKCEFRIAVACRFIWAAIERPNGSEFVYYFISAINTISLVKSVLCALIAICVPCFVLILIDLRAVGHGKMLPKFWSCDSNRNDLFHVVGQYLYWKRNIRAFPFCLLHSWSKYGWHVFQFI
jgi:hypothetical protein